MKPTLWIKTYSDYIEKYLEGVWDYYPGEHHFVALYLIPRLIELPSLGLPDFVNPDGTKKQRGDIIYWRANDKERRCSLALEVKQTSKRKQLTVTRSEYNLWISDHRMANQGYSGEPHLFVAICIRGVVLMPWERFRQAYLVAAYPNERPAYIPAKINETKIRNAQPCPQSVLTDATDDFFSFAQDEEERKKKEASFIAALEREWSRIWQACPVASAQTA